MLRAQERERERASERRKKLNYDEANAEQLLHSFADAGRQRHSMLALYGADANMTHMTFALKAKNDT